jgi:hypothetical protein
MKPKYEELTREASNIMDILEQELEPEQMELVQTLITLYREIDKTE